MPNEVLQRTRSAGIRQPLTTAAVRAGVRARPLFRFQPDICVPTSALWRNAPASPRQSRLGADGPASSALEPEAAIYRRHNRRVVLRYPRGPGTSRP